MPVLLAPALVSLGVSASVAGPLSSLIFTGLSIALSILFAPDVPEPEKGRQPMKQPIPPRIRIIGERRTGGAIMLYHGIKGRAHVVHALCEGPAQAITRHYLHDDVITLDGSGYAIEGGDDGRYGENRVLIETRLGTTPQTAFDDAVDDIDDDAIWSEDHRLDGIVAAHMKARDAGADEQGKRFPFGLPIYSAAVRATEVFDPRDVAQDWEDPDTWSYAGNDNPILQTMWFLTASIEEGGMALDFGETFSTVLTNIAAQADICDELVAKKGGGTSKRYVSNALYHFSDAPSEILAAILGTCDGFCAERGDGAFELKAGAWDDDDFEIVITDHHIISLDVQRFRPDEDEVTGMIVRYTSTPSSEGHEFVTVDAPVWPRDAYQGGEDHRVRSIDVTYCTDGRQAQRLGKRVATYEMAPVTGTAVLTMWGVQLLDRRGCTIQCSDDPALADATVRLTRVEPNLINGTVEIAFQVFDPDETDAWDAETEEGPLQPAVNTPTGTALSTPTAVTPVPYEADGVINAAIAFDPGEDSGSRVNYRVEWRLVNIGGGQPGPSTRVEFSHDEVEHIADDFWVVTLTDLPAAELEVRIMAYRNNFSAWSGWVDMDTTVLAPGRVQDFEAEADADGLNAELSWTSPNSANFDHAIVYRATVGSDFALATSISGELAGSPDSPMIFTDTTAGPGVWDYWVVAETASDVASVPRGPETVTIDADYLTEADGDTLTEADGDILTTS